MTDLEQELLERTESIYTPNNAVDTKGTKVSFELDELVEYISTHYTKKRPVMSHDEAQKILEQRIYGKGK